MTAASILDQVENWAEGFIMLRETNAALPGASWETEGRMDAVLVPVSWEAETYKKLKFEQGLVGVEVKSYRQDFLNGLKSGQFERYSDSPSICGLYIATCDKVCKTSEVPERYGHIICHTKHPKEPPYEPFHICSCRRHPQWKPVHMEQTALWRILWAAIDQVQDLKRETKEEQQRIMNSLTKKFGHLMSVLVQEANKKETI